MPFKRPIEAMTGRTPTANDLTVFFAGFMLACVVYCFVIAALISGARRLLTNNLHRLINAACGVALVGFAIALGREAIGMFFDLQVARNGMRNRRPAIRIVSRSPISPAYVRCRS